MGDLERGPEMLWCHSDAFDRAKTCFLNSRDWQERGGKNGIHLECSGQGGKYEKSTDWGEADSIAQFAISTVPMKVLVDK